MIWLLYFCCFVFSVLLQGYFSWKIGFLTPAQMQEHGISKGLPFVAHTAMWSDLSLFAGLMATVMVLYAPQWTFGQWTTALLVGFAGSAVMHWGLYVQSPFEQAHVRNGMLTPAGVIHLFYMGFGIAIAILFYTCTRNLSVAAVTWVSVLLVTHVVIGTLVPLKIWATYTRPVWYPVELSFDISTAATIIAVAVTVSVASLWTIRT